MSQRNQQGIALIIVLWGVTLLALLAAGLASTSGLAVRRMSHAIESAEAHAALEKAAAAAELALADSDPAKVWTPDGTKHRVVLDDAVAEIAASSEAGKIDLNHAPPLLLKALFQQAASSEDDGNRLFSAFATWTMPGMGGRALLAVSELAALPGITAPIYRRLAGATTVHNQTGRLNWLLADEATLAVIPEITEQARAALLAGRGRKGYTPDLATLQAFSNAGITEGSTSPDPGTPLFVTLEISVRLPSAAIASGEVLVRLAPREQRPVVVLEWHEPQWQEEDR